MGAPSLTEADNLLSGEMLSGCEEVHYSKHRNFVHDACLDYWEGLLNWHMWTYLAFADIRRRYRRTLIGPFWATLSLAIFIVSMGFLFSALWKTDIATFLPYFSSGFVCWTFTASIITESCTTFTSVEGLLKQVALPYSSFSWLVVARNFLVFLHQVIIYICIALIFHVPVTIYTFLILPAFFLFFISASWLAILLGFFCARFRDLQQVVGSLLQISMFVTPIFWPVSQLGNGSKSYFLVNANPLYHYVSLIRQPLLGLAPSTMSWVVVSCMTVLGWILTMMIMSKKHHNLIFWL
jgi:lipopolysaccharide transport system permease protein